MKKICSALFSCQLRSIDSCYSERGKNDVVWEIPAHMGSVFLGVSL
ncbi:hypothetical protein Q4603_15150 [Zobellia galactanivorans]|nr:hypothetical protein [Zobellia galactanivorans]MDO6809960.1 hypothetical protein [Zobellia galactanivorans]